MRLPLDEAWRAGRDPGIRVLDDGRAGAELGEVRLGQQAGLSVGADQAGLTQVRGRGET